MASDADNVESKTLLQEAKRTLGELQLLRDEAKTLVEESTSFRQKAESEGLFAFNAKEACEKHSSAISGIKGSAEADANAVATFRQQANEVLAGLTTSRASAESDAKVIGELRRAVDERVPEVQEIVQKMMTRLTEAEAQRVEIESVRKEFSTLKEEATAARDTAKSKSDSAEKMAEKASGYFSQITTQHKESDVAAQEIQQHLETSKESADELQAIVAKLKKSNETAVAYEGELKKLRVQSEELNKRIIELLPGATSAGLASAFNSQCSRFKRPQKQWLWTFLICLGLLVMISTPSFIAAISGKPASDWDEIIRSILMRLPLAVPLVWLAIYSGRNYMLSVRMEEDYAYKEAVSRSFEGYKREMETIATTEGIADAIPLTTLCSNVLRAIAERPGRIYESKTRDLSPLGEAQGAVEEATDLAKRQVASA